MAKAPTAKTKKCRDCAANIAVEARRCPECKEPQNWKRWLTLLEPIKSIVTIVGAATIVGLFATVRNVIGSDRADVRVSHASCERRSIKFRVSKFGYNDAIITDIKISNFVRRGPNMENDDIGNDEIEAQLEIEKFSISDKPILINLERSTNDDSFCAAPNICHISIKVFYRDRISGTEYSHGKYCKIPA